MRALDRLDCWHAALEPFMTEPSPSEGLGADLSWFWITYGFHIARSLKGDLILVDVFKHLLPPYAGTGLTLYRGELNLRHQKRIYAVLWRKRHRAPPRG